MNEGILVLNSGSSSIKFSIFSYERENCNLNLVYKGEAEGIQSQLHFVVTDASATKLIDKRIKGKKAEGLSHEDALRILRQWLDTNMADLKIVAAGHRVVHGGDYFTKPVIADTTVIAELEKLVPLAPLHQPHNLAAIKALASLHPDLPQVACFDTAFHVAQPPVAKEFAIPRRLSESGIKRYGFHGLSYEYIAKALPKFAGAEADGRVIVAHLGNGASMCAMKDRQSVATTMGFTALDGLPMGTRSGSIDPGVILYLMSELEMGIDEVTELLYYKSGLLGVSGISNDMRELLESNSPHAARAIDLFVYRIGRELGSLCASLGGLDALVFTAGIGEHSEAIRKRVCEDANWLGISLDEHANVKNGPMVSKDNSGVSVWVIPTDEELMIAEHTYNLINKN